VSHGAYSSAVRVVSVEARHCARQDCPSQTANFVLVLPTSIGESMGSSAVGENDIARGDEARTGVGIEFEFAARKPCMRPSSAARLA
jgi:hypothetical protein